MSRLWSPRENMWTFFLPSRRLLVPVLECSYGRTMALVLSRSHGVGGIPWAGCGGWSACADSFM